MKSPWKISCYCLTRCYHHAMPPGWSIKSRIRAILNLWGWKVIAQTKCDSILLLDYEILKVLRIIHQMTVLLKKSFLTALEARILTSLARIPVVREAMRVAWQSNLIHCWNLLKREFSFLIALSLAGVAHSDGPLISWLPALWWARIPHTGAVQ